MPLRSNLSPPAGSSGREPLLEVADLTVRLPAGADRAYALRGLDLEIASNQIACLVGGSGSGKSLSARAIMRLLPAPGVQVAGGSIRLLGEDILAASPTRMRQIRGAEVGMIFQEPMTALNPLMSIGRQIDEAMRSHGISDRRERWDRALAMLDEVQLPDPGAVYRSFPHQLSGGQRQRAMIAMALVLRPRLLIADEPTTALDVTTQAQILSLIARLQRRHGMGVLFITHDLGVVADIADHVTVLHHGEVVEAGACAAVLRTPRHDYTQLLLASVPGVRRAEARAVADEPVLTLSSVVKSYARRGSFFRGGERVTAVQDVSLTLRRGETLGVVGESGSGKSTTARIAACLLKADGGAVVLEGKDLTRLRPSELRRLRPRLQVVFQDPIGSLNPRHRVGNIVASGPMLHGLDRHAARRRAEETFELVGLERRALERFPHEFSGGQRQRIALARALVMEPKVLIADEAVSALDVTVQAQILNLLQKVRDQLGLSILFITHDLRVAAQICDSIAVMQGGRVVEAGPTAQIFSRPTQAYTRQLLNAIPGNSWLGTASFNPNIAEGARNA